MEPLVFLAIIWAGVFVAGFLARQTKLTPVLYYLAVGAVLVNLGVLPRESDPFIRSFAEVGIILIMFALGFEETTANFMRGIRRSWGIALFGAIAPFVTAYAVADYFWGDYHLSLMFALAMTATAVSLTMVSLKSEGLVKTAAATGIMTSAVLDDIGSLALVAVLVPIAMGTATASPADIALVLGKAVLFFVIITLIGAWIFPHDLTGRASRIPFIRHFNIRRLLLSGEGENSVLTALLLAMVAGILAHEFGFHPAVGAYMAGLILREEYFTSESRPAISHYAKTKDILDNVAFTWIGPVFFVELGTKIVLDVDLFLSIIPQAAILTIGLFVAQIASAALAARYTGRYSFEESMLIGFGMLGRAELAFVVMDIAYVQHPILNDQAFYTLMVSAFFLNVAVPITIAWWKPRYVRSREERKP